MSRIEKIYLRPTRPNDLVAREDKHRLMVERGSITDAINLDDAELDQLIEAIVTYAPTRLGRLLGHAVARPASTPEEKS